VIPGEFMRYVIYCRVSPKGSDYYREGETSCAMQEAIGRKWVSAQGGEVVTVLVDELESGKDTNREAFRKLLDDLDWGEPDWDAVWVYKLDRLSRNHRDMILFLDDLQKKNRGLVSYLEHIDFSTPWGRASLAIFSVIAQLQREETSVRTRDKMVHIASQGGLPYGKPAFGYRRDGAHNNVPVIDPEKAAIVRDWFARVLRGETPASFQLQRKMSKNQIYCLLRNPIYLGKVAYNGKIYQGKHEPIIDPETFERVQQMLPAGRSSSRPLAQKDHKYLLAGMVFCHCGKALTPYSSHGRHAVKYHYYRCTDRVDCKGPQIPASDLEAAVIRSIGETPFTREHIQRMHEHLAAEKEEFLKQTLPELARLEKEAKELRAKRDKISGTMLDLVGEDSAGLEFWSKQLSDILGLLKGVESRVEELRAARETGLGPFESVEETVRELQNYSDALREANDPEAQRMALRHILSRVDLLEGIQGVRVTLRTGEDRPITAGSRGASSVKEWLRRLELFAPLEIHFRRRNCPHYFGAMTG